MTEEIEEDLQGFKDAQLQLKAIYRKLEIPKGFFKCHRCNEYVEKDYCEAPNFGKGCKYIRECLDYNNHKV